MKKEKWIKSIAGICIIAVGITGYIIYSNKPVKLIVGEVSQSNIKEQVELNGTIESENSKAYYSSVTAPISELKVKKGDFVKEGDLMLDFDVSDLESALEQAKLGTKANEAGLQASINTDAKNRVSYNNANTSLDILEQQIADEKSTISNLQESLTSAQEKASQITALTTKMATLTDAKELKSLQKEIDSLNEEYDSYDVASITGDLAYHQTELTQLLTSQSEYKAQQKTADASMVDSALKEQLKTAEDSSKVTENQAEEELTKAMQGVTADFDGIVSSIAVEEGAFVPEGTRLFVVESYEDLKVSVKVSKYDIGKLELEQKAQVIVAGSQYEATVNKINKMAETQGSDKPEILVELHIENPDEKIYLGLEADVTIITNQKEDVLSIPSLAVYTDDEGVYCYAIEDGVITKKYFTKGIEGDNQVEVIGGIEEGTQVITDAVTDDSIGKRASGIRG